MTGRTSRGIPDQLCFRNSSVWTKSVKLIQIILQLHNETAELFCSYSGKRLLLILKWMTQSYCGLDPKVQCKKRPAGAGGRGWNQIKWTKKLNSLNQHLKAYFKNLLIFCDRKSCLTYSKSAFTGPVTLNLQFHQHNQ